MPANSAQFSESSRRRAEADAKDERARQVAGTGYLPRPEVPDHAKRERSEKVLGDNLAGLKAATAKPLGSLYYGDNLDILRHRIATESVDLVYLDPPFNSKRAFNLIFKDESGRKSDAQFKAFEDTWHWGPGPETTFEYLTNTARHGGNVPDKISALISALRQGLGENQLLAYLVEMSARLVELHRVLKSTGSLYLHCDPTASHYLKIILDAIFGPSRFRSEIVWKRTGAHSDTKQGRRIHGHIHDLLLFYTKGDTWTWNPVFSAYAGGYLASEYRHVAPDGRRYKETDLTAAKPGGDTKYEWRVKRSGTNTRWQADLHEEYLNPHTGWDYRGVRPYRGRFWAYSKQNMIDFDKKAKLIHRRTGVPRLMQFADEMPGIALQDLWDDLPAIGAGSRERVGYPTQKPLALLRRIIESASGPGDVILDPFCGCGTAIIAAQELGRAWMGIDITWLAIAVMKNRLLEDFGIDRVDVEGEPTEVEGARELVNRSDGRYQFQWWALGKVDAKPVGGVKKKGKDRGIDGIITFTDKGAVLRSVIVSVKSGTVNPGMVRDLKGTLGRERVIGIFITLEEASREMRLEADRSGFFHSELWDRDYPRVQILSVRELLAGKKPELPAFVVPHERPRRVGRGPAGEQQELFGETAR